MSTRPIVSIPAMFCHARVHPPLRSRTDPDYDPVDIALEDQATLLAGLIDAPVAMSQLGHKDVSCVIDSLVTREGYLDKKEFAAARDELQKHNTHRTLGLVTNAFVGRDKWIYASFQITRGNGEVRYNLLKNGILSDTSITHLVLSNGIRVVELALCKEAGRPGCKVVDCNQTPDAFMADQTTPPPPATDTAAQESIEKRALAALQNYSKEDQDVVKKFFQTMKGNHTKRTQKQEQLHELTKQELAATKKELEGLSKKLEKATEAAIDELIAMANEADVEGKPTIPLTCKEAITKEAIMAPTLLGAVQACVHKMYQKRPLNTSWFKETDPDAEPPSKRHAPESKEDDAYGAEIDFKAFSLYAS